VALEVKSGRARQTPSGLVKWRNENPASSLRVVGSGGIGLEEFFASSVF